MDHNYWESTSNNHQLQPGKQNQLNGTLLKTSTSAPLVVNRLQVIFPDGVEVYVQVHNVFCNYELPLHIDLRKVAYGSVNVDYDRAKGILHKQLRNPMCNVKIYSSGKVVINGCKSEEDCKRVARTIGRMVQKSMGRLDQRICIRKYRVSNILAICRMPFDIRIQELSRKYKDARYEPELMVGLEWNLTEPKANLRIHTTGTITVTGATSEANVIATVEKIYPFVKEFATQRTSTKLDVDSTLFGGNAARNRNRRRPKQQNATDRSISPPERYRPIPKRARNQLQGTGIYNNAIHHSDEEDIWEFEQDGDDEDDDE